MKISGITGLILGAALLAACSGVHHRGNDVIPGPTAGEAARTEIFLVVELGGEFFIQVDTPALEGLVDPGKDVARVDAWDDMDGWAFVGTLTADAALRVHRALGNLGPIEVMDGGLSVEDVFLGAPVLVGRVVPHFGEVQALDDQGIYLDDEDQEALRRQFLTGCPTKIMIPVQGELYDVMFSWARTRSDLRPEVAIFDMRAEDARAVEASEVAAAMPAWAAAVARVDAAYEKEEDQGEPEDLLDDVWTGSQLDEDGEPVGPAWLYYYVHHGETMCEMGPDEARLAALWAPNAPLDKPMVLVTGEGVTLVIEPYLIGDLDGDGAIEVIGLTDDLTGEVQLLRIKDGAFETLKSAGPMYRDCPC